MDGKAKRQGWEETLRVMKLGTGASPLYLPRITGAAPGPGITSWASEPEIRAWVGWGRKTGGQQQPTPLSTPRRRVGVALNTGI